MRQIITQTSKRAAAPQWPRCDFFSLGDADRQRLGAVAPI
jgi:hypothetical protein